MVDAPIDHVFGEGMVCYADPLVEERVQRKLATGKGVAELETGC